MKQKKKHITVLLGGWNDESDVSHSSGKDVIKALKELSYTVTAIDAPRCPRKLLTAIPQNTDVIFNALHGRGTEDGNIQGLLNLLGIPYTHSGLLSSALAMDKSMAKRIFSQNNILSPKGGIFPIKAIREKHVIQPPYVVKPNYEGSSLGVYIIEKGDEPPKLEEWRFSKTALVEEYIPGREIFVSIMGDKSLGIVEVNPSVKFYDYRAKYTKGITEYICPANIDEEIRHKAEEISLKAFHALECRGIARTDIRYNPEAPIGKQLYLLEVNTQPGLTPLSLFPMAAKKYGLSYNELIDWIVRSATCDPKI